ncbi:hypothetical protein HRV97_01215 [Sphingomonas sp. HHU CXW]|uniref:Uncharacterized protein n=1 Tax=Sphingomonas hominis TaxID=2741495 RepID=A0ABX2JIR7_9SPHN|nr:hypothetical protein [Sphingomonas hominis]NTS63778.1 hypothetical protein [Sphingomonas hominis]
MVTAPAPLAHARRAMWLAFAALLIAPLIAMRLTPEVNWTTSDFAAAALLLGTLGLAVDVATRLLHRPHARRLAIAAVTAAVALVWAEGAVGLFH